ncbi:MAG: M23 family metallopeptidase [Chloroflexota bacterium]|nr:M23 family metallopeptidase [Chloroflexota bacterium]MBI5704624.1 M23 family metallopeptidase [Chloroflexota bacterium]
MNQTTGNPEDFKSRPTPSRLWQILRLIPLALMLLSVGILVVMFLMGGMIKIAAWYLAQLLLPILGLLSLTTLVIYAIAKRKFNRLMGMTVISALVCLSPAVMLVKPIAFPASLEKTTPSATVRLPADVPLQVAWGGDKIETNYHAAAPDQRWAYDFLVAPFLNGSDKVEDYGCYGVPVLAPADGLVVKTRDGEPDEVPGISSNNLTAPEGNFVAIQLKETGTYLIIAHLKPGSVRVKVGDTVVEGQVIGACGNSGNTSEPHIHIHHQRQDPNLYPLNFAEGLPLYFRDHNGPPMPVGGFRMDGERIILTGDVVQHIGK